MRVTTVFVPKGFGQKIGDLALQHDISAVSISESRRMQRNSETPLEVVTFQSNTRNTKEFVETLMDAAYYDPKTFSFSTRHPQSLFGREPVQKATYPLTRPTAEVYEELWQFSQITLSLICRVFLAALLVAYGIREDYMPLIIAGLLFLPYHHFLLGIGVGAATGEWKLLKKAGLAFFLGTLLILLSGVVVGLLTDKGIGFTQFTEARFGFSILISAIIGGAAGFGAIDDAGRRELIGLAATAHLSVYPVWFGLKWVYGFEPADRPLESLGMFCMNTVLITAFAILVLKLMRMRGSGIRRFVKAFR